MLPDRIFAVAEGVSRQLSFEQFKAARARRSVQFLVDSIDPRSEESMHGADNLWYGQSC